MPIMVIALFFTPDPLPAIFLVAGPGNYAKFLNIPDARFGKFGVSG
jgi:hypothetical protein